MLVQLCNAIGHPIKICLKISFIELNDTLKISRYLILKDLNPKFLRQLWHQHGQQKSTGPVCDACVSGRRAYVMFAPLAWSRGIPANPAPPTISRSPARGPRECVRYWSRVRCARTDRPRVRGAQGRRLPFFLAHVETGTRAEGRRRDAYRRCVWATRVSF